MMIWKRRKKPPVRALLFDIGGVVVKARLEGFLQAGSLVYGCSEKVLARHIASLVEELERGEIDSYSLWEELGQKLESKGVGKAQDPEKLERLWAQMLEDSLQVDPEMLALCRRLQGKLPMGVLSNTITEHAAYLQKFGVYDIFNPCVLSFEVGMRKPEPGIYQLACDLINTPPENCLFIDDLKVNIKAAKACKLQTHLFKDRETLEVELKKLGF